MTDAQVVPVGPTEAAMQAARTTILLAHTSRRLLWFLLVAMQLAIATLLALLASIYFMRNTPSSLLWTAAVYFIFADEYVFINRYSAPVAMGYALLSGAFALSALRLMWFSLKSRRLCFGHGAGPQKATLVNAAADTQFGALHYSLQGWFSDFSVHGSRFNHRQLASKVVSLVSQTTAAYLASHSISNVLLNQTYGLVIFLNGISMFAYYRILHRNQLTQRFACLLTDIVLDFVWGCVLPLWMYAPIWKMFQKVLADTLVNSETSAREIRRVFVLSWPSYLLSMIPFANLLTTAVELVSILHDSVTWVGAVRVPVATSFNIRHSRWVNCTHVLLAVYGCVVLAISLSAADIFRLIRLQPQYGCQFPSYPWFSMKEACIKRTINCSSVGIGRLQAELDAALGMLDEGSLCDLSFASCHSLEIPTSLSRFPVIETIIIQHSWIASWPLETNLSDGNFARVKTVKLLDADTNATLHGLVSVPLAKTVEYIRFDRVPNAASILEPVGDNWQHLVYFDCDGCNLTVVPSAVDAMHQLRTLSFGDSNISILRDEFITRWTLALIGIWMDGNTGLMELSDAVWRQAATADMFTMQRTNLSAIPDWVPSVARRGFVVYAYGTPLCDSVKPLVARMLANVRALVLCDESDNS